jgi:hypothetical protein
VESPHNEAVDEDFEGSTDEIQRADDPEGVSGLLQAMLGQAPKFT